MNVVAIAGLALLTAASLLAASLASAAPAQVPLPGDSVYRVEALLHDQNDQARRFEALRGRVRIVSMFYAQCPYVCPLIVDSIKATEKALSEDERSRLAVLLISMDPERDDAAALKQVESKRHLDGTRWTLARTEAGNVRKLAAVLGIQYRKLENREFNHSTVITLLDADGRVLARSSQIGSADPEFVAAVRTALRPPSP